MLVYLASFPRSGNSWVQNLLVHYFDHQSSSIYTGPGSESVIEHDGSFSNVFVEYPSLIVPGRTRRKLGSGSDKLFSPAFRQEIGGLNEVFFVKTHEMPFEDFSEGECVIHILRHPGAALWSYYQFVKQSEHPTITLEAIIRGEWDFGSWSDHTRQWLEIGNHLQGRYMPISYEQLTQSVTLFCQQVTWLTGLLAVQPLGTFPVFKHWQQHDSHIYRSGKVDEWQQSFNDEHRTLLKQYHGVIMPQVGYHLD